MVDANCSDGKANACRVLSSKLQDRYRVSAGTDRLGALEISDFELFVALAGFLDLSADIPFPHSKSAAEP